MASTGASAKSLSKGKKNLALTANVSNSRESTPLALKEVKEAPPAKSDAEASFICFMSPGHWPVDIHTAILFCLCNWFVPNRRKKTCPECRTKVKEIPAPAFLVKQMVEIFTQRTELMPSDESVEQHVRRRKEEIVAMEKDRDGPLGLFKGTFPERKSELFLDEADGVFRCRSCGNEHEGGPVCQMCGAEIDDDGYGFSDIDEEGETDLDDLDSLELDLDAGLGDHFHPDYLDMDASERAAHLMHRHLHHHRFSNIIWHLRHHHHSHGDHSESDSMNEDDSDEEDAGSLQGFVVDDEVAVRGISREPTETPSVITIDSENESDEGGEISSRPQRGRHGVRQRMRRPRLSPSESSVTSDGHGTDSEGDMTDNTEVLREAGWSPLDQGNDSDRNTDDESITQRMVGREVSESGDNEGSEDNEDGGDYDQYPDDMSETPGYETPTEARLRYHVDSGRYPTISEDDDADDDDSESEIDRDGDTEMSVSPGFSREDRSESVESRYAIGENLGVSHQIHEIEDDSEASSVPPQPPRRRRPRRYNQPPRVQQYDARISGLFADYQLNFRGAFSPENLLPADLHSDLQVLEPTPRTRRGPSYRVSARRIDNLRNAMSPPGIRLASSYTELLEEFSSKDLRTVGNYTLGRLIGKGSFGKVYLATHKLTNGSKVVLKSANKDDSNLAREIHHHRQFLHPHIARLYEVIVTETLVWLVLEYCPGDELYTYLLKNGPLPVEKVQRVFTQLVGAVSYVHNSSCVHRDLKLENILLDKHENVKLCDFGFTREYEGKASYLQTFCGTICYSAPEMLKGEKYAGEKVDVWSLGVILYALLCGELPFDEDDDNATRVRILGNEPKWPDHLTPDARSLIGSLLSKRPLLRPTLPDILAHPFLAEYAPQQQAILKLQRPAPFSTPLEKETLQRMRSAGVDIDQVIENVLAKRCDSLAGWWSLLIEKEQRKQERRERKRKEREAEHRTSRRLSGASSRIAPTLREVEEEDQNGRIGEPPRSRGRKERRSAHYPEIVLTDLPNLPEHIQLTSPGLSTPPPPIEKDSIRSASSSRHRRPIPPPKEGTLRSARSRGSTLQLVTSNPDLLSPNAAATKPARRKYQHPFISQLAHWKHWILDSAKRAKSPGKRTARSTPDLLQRSTHSSKSGQKDLTPRPIPSKAPPPQTTIPSGPQSYPPVPRIYTSTPNKRHSLSPSPLTPRSGFRRASTGTNLRGRKSTSSSVSSVRSIHHHQHSHSKASSTSSNGSGSMSRVSLPTRSPHHSVKVLPATPTTSTFPSNIRLVRQPPISSFNEGWGVPGLGHGFDSLPANSLVFAKRKKNIFKGPMLNTAASNGPGGGGVGSSSHSRAASHSRSTSVGGRRSGEIIQEEDEDEIEEVDEFSPSVGPVETEEEMFAPPSSTLTEKVPTTDSAPRLDPLEI
ncbi:hypothetical protein B7463_g9618, partial [Scytalidium lignicola]